MPICRAPLLPLALVLLAAGGCGDNLTFPVGPTPYEPAPPVELTCVPNLDGQIDAAEMAPALDVPVSYLVNVIGTDRAVDLVGGVDARGRRVWDWTEPERDPVAIVQASAIRDRWYAGSFPADAFVVPIDAAGRVEGVYRHDPNVGSFELLGVASRDLNPPEGRTLWSYTTPVVLYRFPMRDGDGHVSVGEVREGMVRGLPYVAQDTYAVGVTGTGQLALPHVTFTQVLRVRTRVISQPAVGQATAWWQVSFLFECFGEVARATSRVGEVEADFTTAAEVRRLGL